MKQGDGLQVGVGVGQTLRRGVCILPDNCLVPILLCLGIVLTTNLIKRNQKRVSGWEKGASAVLTIFILFFDFKNVPLFKGDFTFFSRLEWVDGFEFWQGRFGGRWWRWWRGLRRWRWRWWCCTSLLGSSYGDRRPAGWYGGGADDRRRSGSIVCDRRGHRSRAIGGRESRCWPTACCWWLITSTLILGGGRNRSRSWNRPWLLLLPVSPTIHGCFCTNQTSRFYIQRRVNQSVDPPPTISYDLPLEAGSPDGTRTT